MGQHSIYTDRYFDYPDRSWTRQGTELRVRTITDELGPTRALLTFKEPAVDHASGSKPEHETAVGDADVLTTVLTALGVEQIIAFEKDCLNYRFTAQGCDLLATVVTVPELAGQTFIELETSADPGDVDAALGVVRSVLRELGIEDSDLTTQAYRCGRDPKRRRPVTPLSARGRAACPCRCNRRSVVSIGHNPVWGTGGGWS
jgi:adenylate cyclase, class 2